MKSIKLTCQHSKAFNCKLNTELAKQNKILHKMRFKVTMINDQGKIFDETKIANNKDEAKMNVHSFNPSSKIIHASWVFK